MIIRDYQLSENMEKGWEHDWVPIEDISSHLQLAVICSEDQRYLKHHGYDIKAIERAIYCISEDGYVKVLRLILHF